VPAAFAAGLGVALWIFLLPAGVVPKGPTPVLPGLGGAVGRVAADLPVPRASKVPKAASAHPQIVVALRPPATNAREVHHRTRTVVVRRAPSAPVRAVARPTRKAPVTKSELFSIPPRGKGEARGHGPKSKTATQAPLPAGRGKALGRSNEHEDRVPPGLAKKRPPASAPGPPPRPKSKGGGNGRDNGGGNEDKGNGGGNGRKWEND
jgi:hypothetical protein